MQRGNLLTGHKHADDHVKSKESCAYIYSYNVALALEIDINISTLSIHILENHVLQLD